MPATADWHRRFNEPPWTGNHGLDTHTLPFALCWICSKGECHSVQSKVVMKRMWFLRIFGFGCEITKSADSDIDKSSHEEFSVNKNVGYPAVLHGLQLSKL